jgi:hypothetical protein
MSNNVCNNVAYLNSIDQKRRFQLLNIPPVRYDNLATNPYNQINPTTGVRITKFDLDMRRKSEILKYSSNRMSTQTNSLTKAQKYTQAISGSYKSRTYSQTYIDDNTTNGVLNTCPRVMKPTTASDIPGPPILLYEDPQIPLYNFAGELDKPIYGIINQELNIYPMMWNNTVPVNVQNTDSISGNSTITSIYILQPNSPTLNYTITTPISIYLTGSLKPEYTSYNQANAISINIQSPKINVNYSFTSVTLNPSPTIIFTTSPPLTLDISVNAQKSTYTASCYLGLLTISNLILPVQKGFIYDIQVGIKYSVENINNSQYDEYCTPPKIISYLNTSQQQAAKTNVNCTLYGNRSIPSPFPILQVRLT